MTDQPEALRLADLLDVIYAKPAASELRRLHAVEFKYNELLFAVGSKRVGETRHDTALRYIKQAEDNITYGPAKAEGAKHMTDQPEALRLADLIQSRYGNDTNDEAAAELRRLHAANLDCVAWFAAVKAERDELLEALKAITAAPDLRTYGLAMQNACIAIERAEGAPK
jgi:hypothetical protein